MLTKNAPTLTSQRHPFHILSSSPFPFFTSLFLLLWLAPQVFFLHGLPFAGLPRADLIHGGVVGLYVTVLSWFLTIIKESRWGYHTRKVQHGLRTGMLLFIASEVMFFFAFFWAFFHYSIVPSVALGARWLPDDCQELDAFALPLVNTVLLLASGVTITVAHAYIVKNDKTKFSWYLLLTIILGSTFLFCQYYEYSAGVKFSWRDNLFGSIFFITTGFHGLHVTIGTLFLLFCWARQALSDVVENGMYWGFAARHHFGFEAAAWYWHFVDVVWLFLFITIYWWGSNELWQRLNYWSFYLRSDSFSSLRFHTLISLQQQCLS